MKLSLCTWNLNGIRSAWQKGLQGFLETNAPDILCVQEIKASREHVAEIFTTDSNFEAYSAPAEKPGYSGVASLLYKKKSRSLGLTRSTDKLGFAAYEREGRFLLQEFSRFTLLNAYFPSGTSGEARQEFKYKFLADFYQYLKDLSPKQRARLVICGDFNICHRAIDIHHPDYADKKQLTGFQTAEREWMDRFTDLGFYDAFRSLHPESVAYSWWSFRAGSRKKNLGWRIDYIFLGRELMECASSANILVDIVGSDHCPVVVELNL